MGGLAVGMSVPLMASALRDLPGTSEPPARLHAVLDLPRSTESNGDTVAARFVPADPGTLYAQLLHEVHECANAESIPCLGPGGEAWTSDDYDDQQIAADRCLDCPAMFLCRAYAEAAGEKAGTWGGETRDPARKPPLDTASARADRARWKRKKSPVQTEIVPKYLGMFSLKTGAGAPTTHRPNGYPAMNTKTQSPANINADGELTTGHFCKCDCGEVITTKATFRPGHDARMVSNLVAVVVADSLTKAGIDKLAKTLPSDALKAKFLRAAARATAPKPEPEPKAKVEEAA